MSSSGESRICTYLMLLYTGVQYVFTELWLSSLLASHTPEEPLNPRTANVVYYLFNPLHPLWDMWDIKQQQSFSIYPYFVRHIVSHYLTELHQDSSASGGFRPSYRRLL